MQPETSSGHQPPGGDRTRRVTRQEVEGSKAVLRGRVRAARRLRPEDERLRLAERLRDVAMGRPEWASATVATCYLAGSTEPGTTPLRAALAAVGIRVILPVVTEAGGEPVLDWATDEGRYTVSRYFSLPEAAGPRLGPAAIGRADVVVVPALAVDTLGRRLGQGGGYYDRALAMARIDAPVVAVLHDDELLDADVEPVPALPHDRRVDAVLTPSRWFSIRT